MQFSIKTNFPQVQRAFDRAAKQVPFALARALTRTAQDVKAAEEKEIAKVFNRPTPYTQRAVYVKPATKQNLQALVWLKDGNRPQHYLMPQIDGGSRPRKRFEEILMKAGYMSSSERAVPGAGAQLDSYGNMSRGQIVKIISQLRAFNLAGSDGNATNSKRSRAKRVKEQYFMSRGKGVAVGGGSWKRGNKSQHLPRGIYLRRSFGPLGTAIKPVLVFVNSANYRRRFPFFEVAQRTINERFPVHFKASFEDALRTARFSQQGSLL